MEMNIRNRLFLMMIMLMVSLGIAGCSTDAPEGSAESEAPVELGEDVGVEEAIEDRYMIEDLGDRISFVDGRGQLLEISKKPGRVVVLMNSFVDIWVENGGEMVGMIEDPYNVVPGTENVETVGRFGGISLEKIISLEPDLVILSSNSRSSSELIEPLQESGINILPLTYEFKEDYFKISEIFARLNDRMDMYEENAAQVKQDIEDIVQRIPNEDNPSVLILFATSKSVTARGSLSTLGEMFKDLKVNNIAENGALMETAQFSMEQVIADDPDFIFVQAMGSDMEAVNERLVSEVESNPAWNQLSAVKDGKYVILSKDLYTYKANSRYGEAYRGLAEMLYPEIFQ